VSGVVLVGVGDKGMGGECGRGREGEGIGRDELTTRARTDMSRRCNIQKAQDANQRLPS
jgi:hypothetical protein